MLLDLSRALHLIPLHRRRQWAALVPLALAAAILESLGASIVLALGSFIADPSQMASIPVVGGLTARVPSQASARFIGLACAGVIVFYIGRSILLTLFTWIQDTVVHRTASEVAQQLFDAYLQAPYVFHLRRNSASLIQTMGQSVEAVFAFGLGSTVNLVTEALTVLGLVGLLAFSAPLATIASMATVGVMLLGPLLVTRRLSQRYGAEIKRLNESLLRDLQQSLASFKEVRVMGAEHYFHSVFAGHRGHLAIIRARQGALLTGVRVFVETIFVVAVLVAITVLTSRGAGRGQLLGLMALYAYAGFRIVPSANRMIFNYTMFQGARSHIVGLSRDLAQLQPPPAPSNDSAAPLTFNDRIELDAVNFAYGEGRAPALQDVSLTIRRGESVGIVGATGAGKSTLVDVLLGLLAPQSGMVRADGRSVGTNLRSWQQRLGYVPQMFALLDDTLRRNVAFGRPDTEIDDARVWTALRLAHLDDTASALPEQLDTRLGERGARLSGGERQRVAVARALYHNPDVLVFDEATSALDHTTEHGIIRAIDELKGTKTLIVVAHRLSTVRGCDRIVFLQDGRITGEGTYATLLESHPAFRGMVTAGTAS